MGVNTERALLAISQGLGDFAQIHYQKERDRVMMAREENLLRLQATIGEESRARERAHDAEQRGLDRSAAAASDKARLEASERQHNESIAVQREGLGLQREGNELARLDRMDKGYMAQLQDIDSRLAELNDFVTQGRAKGEIVDEAALAPVQQEIDGLKAQRTALQQERAYTLARSGDSRYTKLSAEQVAQLRKEGKIPGENTPRQGPKPDAPAPAPASAAQGPRPQVPAAPPKPPGMQAREERKQARTLVPNAGKGERRDIAGEAGKGVRQAREILGKLDARKNQGAIVSAYKRGDKLSADEAQALRDIGRERLKGVFKLSDEDLAKIYKQ